MEDEIAKTEMIGIYPDLSEIEIVAKIGKPLRMPTGEWACPTAIDGFYESPKNVYGEDGIQAISLALTLIYKLLSGFIEKEGHRLVDRQEKEDIPLDAIFGRGEGKR
jgi:hypothetical protein